MGLILFFNTGRCHPRHFNLDLQARNSPGYDRHEAPCTLHEVMASAEDVTLLRKLSTHERQLLGTQPAKRLCKLLKIDNEYLRAPGSKENKERCLMSAWLA